ncbi:MAG: hypothetical protein K8S97_12020 [Anaerolineae bacterium]|nr:hypothetical protein [Anaerolineae bacterium]
MEFAKFAAMLEYSGLFFSRINQLGDPYEGALTAPMARMFAAQEPDRTVAREGALQYVGVSCWHMNYHESAGMWKLYSDCDNAIAIRSTYAQLRACLDVPIMIGVVKYIDYARERMPNEGHVLDRIMHKRKSYEHERELRAVHWSVPPTEGAALFASPPPEPPEHGVWETLDMNQLIDRIYTAPTADHWLKDLVQRLCQRYGVVKEIERSKILDRPMH